MNKFESLKVGDKAQIKHTITQFDIEKLVDLMGETIRVNGGQFML